MKKLLLRQVLGLLRENAITQDAAVRLLKGIETASPIAIVGVSAVMPRSLDLGDFWQKLCGGEDFVGDLPGCRRRDADDFYANTTTFISNKRYWDAAYVNSVDGFDAEFFGLSTAEAETMDPAHRIFLQCVYHGLEDAGIPSQSLRGSRTGVYVANSGSNYLEGLGALSPLAIPGNLPPFLAARISFLLDLHGPAFSLQSTCSSSLLAVHQACQAIRADDCDLAIVGGATLFVYPGNVEGVFMTAAGIVAPGERSRPFDDGADGMGRGEGVIAMVLKPLETALRDGDSVRAVILGSAANNDGRSATLTAPNPIAQTDVLDRAWTAAGINPESLSYIEAHGTGTELGDPIEVSALTVAFERATDRKQFCGIGSVKGNIGHLVDGAAGLSGLLKVVLALENEQIPPSININRPNHHIDFINSPVFPVVTCRSWPRRDEPRRAGVSAFSFNGTNVHVVLEEAPSKDIAPSIAQDEGTPFLFLFSAKTEDGITSLLQDYAKYIQTMRPCLADLAYTLAVGRDHHALRRAYVATSAEELIETLLGKEQCIVAANYKDFAGLKEVYLAGNDLDWEIVSPRGRNKLHMPSYPFSKTRFWRSIPRQSGTNPALGALPVEIEEVEAAILQLWQDVLPDTKVESTTNFFDAGGTSLQLMHVRANISQIFNVELPFTVLFQANTPTRLARTVMEAIPQQPCATSEPVEQSLQHPRSLGASESQKGFWFLRHIEGTSAFYHAPIVVRLRGSLDLVRLSQALRLIEARHELLRVRFEADADDNLCIYPRQKPGPEVEIVDLEGIHSEDRQRHALRVALREQDRPFSFPADAPWRAAVVRASEDEHVLCITLHHLVADLGSLHVLSEELQTTYDCLMRGEELTFEAPAQFGAFVRREQRLLEGAQGEELRRFWCEYLAGAEEIRLPSDFKRPDELRYDGITLPLEFPKELNDELRSFCGQANVTLYVLLLASFGRFLSKKGGTKDVLVASETANRGWHGAEGIIGPLVNQFLIRLRIDDQDSFRSLLESTRGGFVDAMDHAEFPFSKVVEAMRSAGTPGRLPPVRVKMLMDSFRPPRSTSGALGVEFVEVPVEHSAFDLTIRLSDHSGILSGNVTFAKALYRPETIEQWLSEWMGALRDELRQPDALLFAAPKTSSGLSSIAGRRRSVRRPHADDVSIRPIRPGWEFPVCIRRQRHDISLTQWICDNHDLVASELSHRGAILFRDFNVTTVDEFDGAARAVHPTLVEYSEASTPRPEYKSKIYVSTQYPKYHEIQAHSELSYTNAWPMKALFMCVQPSLEGGETPLADNREILGRIAPRLRKKFREKGVMYVRNYGEGLIVPWQTAFGTNEREVVEQFCRTNSPMTCEWKSDGGLRTRQVRHATVNHPDIGDECWFNQALHFHIDGLGHEIASDVRENYCDDDLPSNALFGDGSSITAVELAQIGQAIARSSHYVPWERGDVMLLDNVLMSHGRNRFVGDREVVAAFVEPRRDEPMTP